MKKKIGLQLYSLKDILNERNFVEILKKVKSYGFEGVEGVERDIDPDTVHLFCGKNPSEVKSILAEVGLEMISIHLGLNDLNENFSSIVKYHKDLGCDTIVLATIPGVYFRDRETIKNAVKDLRESAKKVKDEGLRLALHNCPFNFVSPQSYDLFAEEVDEELALQPDAGNAQIVGIDPVQYFSKMKNPFASIHIKDGKTASKNMLPLDKGEEGKEKETIWGKFAEMSTSIGKGMVDIREFFKLGESRCVDWFIVEEEMTSDPLKTVERAYNYISGLMNG